MRKSKSTGNFFICLFYNLILNIDRAIPAVIFLALHFWLGISLWWFWIVLGLWFISIAGRMILIGWAEGFSSDLEPYKENKNPYSAGKYQSKIKNKTDDKEG